MAAKKSLLYPRRRRLKFVANPGEANSIRLAWRQVSRLLARLLFPVDFVGVGVAKPETSGELQDAAKSEEFAA